MKSQSLGLLSNLRKYISRAIGILLVVMSTWQGISIGIDTAMAAPAIDLQVPASIGSKKEIVVKELEARAAIEQDRVRSAMKDGNKSAKKTMDKAKDAMEKTTNKVEDSAKKAVEKTKNFLGF